LIQLFVLNCVLICRVPGDTIHAELLYSVQRDQQTQHHHFRLHAVTIYTAYQYATQHKTFYQYFIF